jgi:hypothetical protein
VALTLRNVVNRPLTNQEVDDNFTYLETSVASNIETIDRDSLIVKEHFSGLPATAYTESYALEGNTLVTGDGPNGIAGKVYVYYDLTNAANGADLTIFGGADYRFGKHVALQDNLLVVSSLGYDNTNTYQYSGRVYVYDIASSTPTTPLFVLDDPNAAYSSGFGARVALRDNVLIVAADPGYNATNPIGRIYAYYIDVTDTSNVTPLWTVDAPSQTDRSDFGATLAIDSDYVYVGDEYTNNVLIYSIVDGSSQGNVSSNFTWPDGSRPTSIKKFTAGTRWYSWTGTDASGNWKVWVWDTLRQLFNVFDTDATGGGESAAGNIYRDTLTISTSTDSDSIELWDIPSKTLITKVETSLGGFTVLATTLNDRWLVTAGRSWELKSSLGRRVNSIEAQVKINGVVKLKTLNLSTDTAILAQRDHSVVIKGVQNSTQFKYDLSHFNEGDLAFDSKIYWGSTSASTVSFPQQTVTDLLSTDNDSTFGRTASIAGPYVTLPSNVSANNAPVGRITFFDIRNDEFRQLAKHAGGGADTDFGTTIRSFYDKKPDDITPSNEETFYIAAQQSYWAQWGYIHVYTDPLGDGATKPISQPLYASSPTTSAKGFIIQGVTTDIDDAEFYFTTDGKRVALNTGGAIYLHNISKGNNSNNTTYDAVTEADASIPKPSDGSYNLLGTDSGYIIASKSGRGTGNTAPTLVLFDETSLDVEVELTVPDYEFSDENIQSSGIIVLSSPRIENGRLYIQINGLSNESDLTGETALSVGEKKLAIYDVNTWKLIRTIDTGHSVVFIDGNYVISKDTYGEPEHSIFKLETKNDVIDLSNINFAEQNDLTAAVTWANVPDANITQSSVTQHQSALSLTKSQITDFGTYLTSETLTTLTADSANTNLIYTDENGNPNTIDLSWAIDDTNLARITNGTVNANTGIATFQRDDTTTFTVDFSALIDTTPFAASLFHTLDNPNAYGTVNDDRFGYAVAISGNYAIIGAYYEDDATGSNSGKAYIYDVTTGSLLHTLDNPNAYSTSGNDYFGRSVAISGNYAIVGAWYEDDAGGTQSGKAYIFDVATGTLLHTLGNPNAYGTSADDWFGLSVSISGNYAIVGARLEDEASGSNSGKAYIFDVATGTLLHTLDNPNAYGTVIEDNFGWSVAIYGNYAIVGSMDTDSTGHPLAQSGKAYIFNATTGSLVHTLNNPNAYGSSDYDYFGSSLAISGNYAIVGASGEGDASGNSSGKAYIFDVATGTLLHTLDNPNPYGSSSYDNFGNYVSISGNYAIVSAYGEDEASGNSSGKAYIYDATTGSLLHTLDNPNAYGTVGDDNFGYSVSISGNYAIIGAFREDEGAGDNSGKAYIYQLSASAYVPSADEFNSLASAATQVVADTTPELGGDLTINSKAFVGNVKITNGTSDIIQLNDAAGVAEIKSPTYDLSINSIGAISISPATDKNLTLNIDGTGKVRIGQAYYLPNSDGSNGQVLTTDGSGNVTFQDAPATGLQNVVEDTTPQLGGDLDVLDKRIVSSNSDIVIDARDSGNHIKLKGVDGSGVIVDTSTMWINAGGGNYLTDSEIKVTWSSVEIFGLSYPSSDGSNGQVLTTDGAGNLTFTDIPSSISNVVEDTTPQLGGDLDVLDKKIVSSTGDIEINSGFENNIILKGTDGTAHVVVDTGKFWVNTGGGNYLTNSKFTVDSAVKIHGIAYPSTDGSNGQVLTTDGSGNLSFSTISADLVSDTTPELGGDLDANGYKITNADRIEFGTATTKVGDIRTITATSSLAATFDVAVFPQSDYRSLKVMIQGKNTGTGDYYISELLCFHDGTDAYSTEYATMYTSDEPDFEVVPVLNNGNFIVRITPATDHTIEYKFVVQAITS